MGEIRDGQGIMMVRLQYVGFKPLSSLSIIRHVVFFRSISLASLSISTLFSF